MRKHLQLARLDNGWLLGEVNLAGAGASGLESPDNVHGLLISNLAEDDVLAIQPGGDNGGDEELGAVAEMYVSEVFLKIGAGCSLRVWSSVGHGEKSWLGVLLGEVLIGELVTVDGLATSALKGG